MTSLNEIETEIESKTAVGNKCYYALGSITQRSLYPNLHRHHNVLTFLMILGCLGPFLITVTSDHR